MKQCLTILLLFCALSSYAQTKVIIIGTVHYETAQLKPDSLTAVLDQLHPDVILLERDSSSFTADFRLRGRILSNEIIATKQYRKNHDVDIRPYDCKGAPQYYTRNNFIEHELKIRKKLFDTKKLMLVDELKSYHEYMEVTGQLELVSKKRIRDLNRPGVNYLVERQQSLMDHELLQLIQHHREFSNDLSHYLRERDFWAYRNKTMVKNIVRFVQSYPQRTIVVMCGFYHKYYLLKALGGVTHQYNFQLCEWPAAD